MDQTRAIPRGKNSWKKKTKKDEGWVGQDWKGIESVRASELGAVHRRGVAALCLVALVLAIGVSSCGGED